MDDHTEAERAKFEAWVTEDGKYPRAAERMTPDGGYRLMATHTAWGVWQAARATLASAPATRDNPSPVDATASLIEAARAVVDRWNTPVWKDVEHTAAFIARLDEAVTRAAGAAPQAQHVGWVRVAERLPEKEQEVLILFHPYGNPSNKARVLEAVHTDGGFYDWDDGLELHHPTHWMPKPALQGAAPPAQQWVPIDGEWYFVRYEGLGKTHEAPALYRGASKAFYSVEFAGIPEREVSVMWRVNHPAPAAPQHQGGGNGKA